MWMLEELEEDYDFILAAPRSNEIIEVNPSGKVPALKDGDAVVTDSIAICTYLADKHGKLTFPAGTLDRARQDGFTQMIVDEIEGALWNWSKNSYIYSDDIAVPAIIPLCRMEFARAMKTLETRFGPGPFLMGDVVTVPDLILGHCAGWAANAKFAVPEDGSLGRYFDRVRSRPAFKRALERGKLETRDI